MRGEDLGRKVGKSGGKDRFSAKEKHFTDREAEKAENQAPKVQNRTKNEGVRHQHLQTDTTLPHAHGKKVGQPGKNLLY